VSGIVTETITWVKVEKPVFDLAGVLINSLGLAAVFAAVACLCGGVLGGIFIVRTLRRRRLGEDAPLALDLGTPAP
jgi:membrane associated rhomboid family serine protease